MRIQTILHFVSLGAVNLEQNTPPATVSPVHTEPAYTSAHARDRHVGFTFGLVNNM
jgi:hypothetical protein